MSEERDRTKELKPGTRAGFVEMQPVQSGPHT